MKTALRRFAALLLLATLMISLAMLTGCGRKNVVYLEGTSRVVELHDGDVVRVPQGERAYQVSGAALVDLMECCEAK